MPTKLPKPQRPSPALSITAGLLVITMGSPPAAALATLVPYGSAQAEYNSNIFALESRAQALAQNGDGKRSDRILRYIAGAKANLPVSQQQLRAQFEGRRLEFDHYDRLNHNEYLASGGLDWRLSKIVDGMVELRQERRMASFEDRNATDLTLETDRVGRGTLNVDITPSWRLETGLKARQLDSPLPSFPEFRLSEQSASVGLKYLLADFVSAGVFADYLKGRFEGTPDSGRFHQESIALTANYAVEQFSRIGAQVGVTQRKDSNGGGGQTALTGALDYDRELTGKTKAKLGLFRRVRSYVGGASSVREDGVAVALAWTPTLKTTTTASYQWTQGRFKDASGTTENSRRSDQGQTLTLNLNYQALPWLAIRPYGGYQSRDSNLALDSFKTKFVGLEVLVRLP